MCDSNKDIQTRLCFLKSDRTSKGLKKSILALCDVPKSCKTSCFVITPKTTLLPVSLLPFKSKLTLVRFCSDGGCKQRANSSARQLWSLSTCQRRETAQEVLKMPQDDNGAAFTLSLSTSNMSETKAKTPRAAEGSGARVAPSYDTARWHRSELHKRSADELLPPRWEHQHFFSAAAERFPVTLLSGSLPLPVRFLLGKPLMLS